jgi:carbonic anhydrase/acetyltransferase-like protein (isoleucine patch superfamily)
MTRADAETMPLLLLPFRDIAPAFAGTPRHAGRMSAVVGRVTIGRHAWLGDYTIIRADGHYVRIGDDFRLGSGSTVHIAHDVYPTLIGDRVTVGRDAVVHACTVGDDCVIEDGVVILDGSVVEPGVVLEAGALVYPRSHLPAGHVYGGRPAKPVRSLSDGELQERAQRLIGAEDQGPPLRPGWSGEREHRGDALEGTFIAATARVRGEVRMARATSIWFACEIQAGDHGLTMGESSNIQDNTIIRCESQPFVLGTKSVVGHNVKLGGCTIGDGSLVGIGSVIAEGTTIDDGVLVAAGTQTAAGQHLEGGWLWGGNPARPLSRMDEKRQDMITQTIRTYMGYAETFALAQQRVRG